VQLRIDQKPSRLAIEGGQVCPNFIELNKAINRSQQMLLRYMPLERKLVEKRVLLDLAFDVHSLLYASLAVVVGLRSMMFWVFAKVYGMRERIVPPDPWFRSLMSVVTLEIGLIGGLVLLLVGLGLAVYALGSWGAEGFGPPAYAQTMRLVIPSSTAILLGFQIIYSAFLSAFSISSPLARPKARYRTVRPKQPDCRL
jgi:hypothetical protein